MAGYDDFNVNVWDTLRVERAGKFKRKKNSTFCLRFCVLFVFFCFVYIFFSRFFFLVWGTFVLPFHCCKSKSAVCKLNYFLIFHFMMIAILEITYPIYFSPIGSLYRVIIILSGQFSFLYKFTISFLMGAWFTSFYSITTIFQSYFFSFCVIFFRQINFIVY